MRNDERRNRRKYTKNHVSQRVIKCWRVKQFNNLIVSLHHRHHTCTWTMELSIACQVPTAHCSDCWALCLAVSQRTIWTNRKTLRKYFVNSETIEIPSILTFFPSFNFCLLSVGSWISRSFSVSLFSPLNIVVEQTLTRIARERRCATVQCVPIRQFASKHRQ